jgi:hypothetical protein
MITSFFFNALQLAIIMSLKFKEKIVYPLSQVNLIDGDFRIALEFLCSTLKGNFVLFWNLSFFLKEKLRGKNSQHVLTLDLRFKNLSLVSSFIDCVENVSIIEEYDK